MIWNYLIHLGIIMVIYFILAVSLNIALGYGGLLNLGHIAFFGIGAYTSSLLTLKFQLPFIISMLLAGIVSSIFGALLTLATRKMKGDYLALATLGFSFVIGSIILNWTELTNGPLGLPGIPRPFILNSDLAYFFFVALISLLCLLIMWRIIHSPFGRVIQAVRDDDLAVRVMGKNSTKLKIKTMSISAFFAGIAGSLFAHYLAFIDPSIFSLHDIIFIFTIVIAGGIASFKGSLFATIIFLLIPELLRFLPLPVIILGPLRMIIYASILILILLYRPRGLYGRIDLQ